MDKETIKKIKATDWDEIVPRLIKYAIGKCFGLKDQSIGKGFQPIDLAMGAITDLISEERNWNPDKQPDLFKYLQWVVNSKLDALLKSWSRNNEASSKSTLISPQTNEQQELDHISDRARNLGPSPEEAALSNERERLKKEIYTLASGDEVVEGLLLCIEDGIIKPKDIATELQLEVSTINNAYKRLRRLSAKLVTFDKSLIEE